MKYPNLFKVLSERKPNPSEYEGRPSSDVFIEFGLNKYRASNQSNEFLYRLSAPYIDILFKSFLHRKKFDFFRQLEKRALEILGKAENKSKETGRSLEEVVSGGITEEDISFLLPNIKHPQHREKGLKFLDKLTGGKKNITPRELFSKIKNVLEIHKELKQRYSREFLSKVNILPVFLDLLQVDFDTDGIDIIFKGNYSSYSNSVMKFIWEDPYSKDITIPPEVIAFKNDPENKEFLEALEKEIESSPYSFDYRASKKRERKVEKIKKKSQE